jgi:hypothetical protein
LVIPLLFFIFCIILPLVITDIHSRSQWA